MSNKNNWSKTANEEVVNTTISSLKNNGITAEYFEDESKLKDRIFQIIPQNAEIMNMTSVTLDSLGISKEIQESGKYNAIKNKIYSMDRKTQGREMQKLMSAPDYVIGSVHAVTQDGKIVVASNTGSQLPAYVYGSGKVIFVVGTQKIVKDLDEAFNRIYEYTLPLESERARKAYGVPGSNVNKLLIINKEIVPERIYLFFINKVIGF